MDCWFELWDAQNASLVGSFDTREAALAVVRSALTSFGPEATESLVLTAEESSGADPRMIAAGADLADLARRKPCPAPKYPT